MVLDQMKVEISQVQLILRLPTWLKLFPRAGSGSDHVGGVTGPGILQEAVALLTRATFTQVCQVCWC